MNQEIDYEKLRRDLEEHYGTAMFAGFGVAMMDLSKIENALDNELIEIAKKKKINLCNYMK